MDNDGPLVELRPVAGNPNRAPLYLSLVGGLNLGDDEYLSLGEKLLIWKADVLQKSAASTLKEREAPSVVDVVVDRLYPCVIDLDVD
jgi:hypothetical protein